MSIPEWLTENYIEEFLKSHHKDLTLKIEKFDIKPTIGKGENYGGYLTKVHVIYNWNNGKEKLENHFICKTSYEEDEFVKEKMKPYDIFNREMSLYEQVLPKMVDLLKEINDTDRLYATAYHVDYKRQALILEDLNVQGYVMADRTQRFDMDHIKLILRKLSKIHATSAVLNEREVGCLEKYDREFFNLLCCARYLQKLNNEEESGKYSEETFALAPYYMDIVKRYFTPTNGHVNVLAHGDVWTNNVMFKYCSKTGKPIDVLLIGFKYSFWGSPTLDLHHFFNTSIQVPLRLHHLDELYQMYHQQFTDTLRKLRYKSNPIPTLKEFKLHVEQKRFFDPTDADYNALMGDDERGMNFKSHLYNNPEIQETLRTLLPLFDRRGLLEINQ